MINPYPEKLIDEASGIEVSNIQHEVWNEGAKAVREEILTIIRDWDRMTGEEGGEEEWQKKYNHSTTELVQVIEQTLKSGE